MKNLWKDENGLGGICVGIANIFGKMIFVHLPSWLKSIGGGGV